MGNGLKILAALVVVAALMGASPANAAEADEPKPDPGPDPTPTPTPDPINVPTPGPNPINEPKPTPKPGPINEPKPEPAKAPTPTAEAAACAWALANRPSSYLDLKRGADALPLWLTKVAYRRVRDTGSVPPVIPADSAIFGRLAQCIAAGLANDKSQEISDEAAACAWALAERPNAYADLTRGNESSADWLSKIAYRRVRGTGPVPPNSDLADLAIFGRLAQCIAAGLAVPPPSGGIDTKNLTAAEKALLDELGVTRPGQFMGAPTEQLRNRGNRKLADWLANIALWRLYTLPESAWTKAGKAAAPWTLEANSPWGPVWTRMRDYLLSTGVPNTAPADWDVNQTDDVNIVTAAEKAAAYLTHGKNLATYPNAPTDELRNRGARAQDDYDANIVYWYLYADPKVNSPTFASAPWVVGNSAKWQPVWKRIRKFLGELP